MRPADDYERARSLILEFGWNATAYQILNPGMALWFTERRDGVIGFVRHGRTVVVGGAPVCALDRLDAIAAEFDRAARARGYKVCYFGAGDRLDNLYAADPGWSRVLLGAQPAWDPRSWSDAVARRQSLRGQFNRARNKGVRVSEWPPDVSENHPALRRCLPEWLATRHLPPLHFLVEPETLDHLRDRRGFVGGGGRRGGGGGSAFLPATARDSLCVGQECAREDSPHATPA